VHIGETRTEDVRISLIDYDEHHVEEKSDLSVEGCIPFKASPTVTWVNVTGIHDIAIIEAFGKVFDIHPLVLEDVVHTGQRPKMEDMGDYLFIVLKMLSHANGENTFETEQLSLIVGSNFVISFQEREGDVFQPIRDRIHKGKGRIRKSGSDYLAYTLMDAIVDNYFVILENMGEKIEILQESVLTEPDPSNLREIQELRREMAFLRRSIWPLREAINALQRTESPLIGETVAPT
jgi:magnesium transporter